MRRIMKCTCIVICFLLVCSCSLASGEDPGMFLSVKPGIFTPDNHHPGIRKGTQNYPESATLLRNLPLARRVDLNTLSAKLNAPYLGMSEQARLMTGTLSAGLSLPTGIYQNPMDLDRSTQFVLLSISKEEKLALKIAGWTLLGACIGGGSALLVNRLDEEGGSIPYKEATIGTALFYGMLFGYVEIEDYFKEKREEEERTQREAEDGELY